jgi:hypothetical protein
MDQPKPLLEYELLSKQPYTFTQEDLLFEVHIRHKAVPSADLEENERRIRDAFFKNLNHVCARPCFPKNMDGVFILMNMEKSHSMVQKQQNIKSLLGIVTKIKNSSGHA